MEAAPTTPRLGARDAQRKASDPEASVWVDASAGTGKTRVLTDRVLRLLLGADGDPVPPSHILCLTFTKAAAAEMSNRLNSNLTEWAVLPDAELADRLQELIGRSALPEALSEARRLLVRVLDTPGGMRIQTIHAFCQAVLARFPLEADIPPHFQVIDERTAGELLGLVQEEVVGAIDANETSALRPALAVVTRHVHELHFPELMTELVNGRGRLARLMQAAGGLRPLIGKLHQELGVQPGSTQENVIADACADSAFDGEGLAMAARALGQGSKTDRVRSIVISNWLDAADMRVRRDGFHDYAKAFLTSAEAKRAHLAGKRVKENHPGALDVLDAEAARLLAVREHCRRAVVAEATGAILTLGNEILGAYQRHKQSRGWLDYDDLILITRALLTRPGGAAWVLYRLDGGIDHILIDEAQDTNPDQWALVSALAEEFYAGIGAHERRRTVFAVGDPKQSIYSFQRADPRAFADMRRWLADKVRAAEQNWLEVPLETSFRSTRPILDAVDCVFMRDRARDGLVFRSGPIRHHSIRTHQAGRVELWPAVETLDTDPPPPWKPPIERTAETSAHGRLASLIADKIVSLCGGEQLPSHARPIEPGDIMVLVRRRNEFLDDLVRRLKERDVPVAGIDRLVLADHIAVMDLISLGRFLLLPEDDLSLAEFLKSPLIGLDDDDLFALAWDRDGQTLWQSLGRRRDLDPRYAAAHRALSNLLARVDLCSPYELYADILGARGGRRQFRARLGIEALDPLDEFLAQALAYERTHVPSLQGFLHWLDTARVEVKRDLDVGRGDSVRIMTVHGAKGLEAPIVFLPDTLQVPHGSSRLVWSPDGGRVLWPPRQDLRDALSREWLDDAKERTNQEYRRLLYVAMTRATDRLYVCGWHTRRKPPDGCWYELVRDGLESVASRVVDPIPGTPGTGSTVLRLETPQIGAPDMASDRPSASVTRRLPEWAKRPPESETAPPGPLVSSPAIEDQSPAQSPLMADDRRAAIRGQLMHRLLQQLPEVPLRQRHDACARFLKRSAPDIDPHSREQIANAALRVLEMPELGPVFASGSMAEVPIAGLLPGEQPRMFSGRVDRLAVTDREVLLVDFKTSDEPPVRPEDVSKAYLRQMAGYWTCLRAIYPDRPINCALVWTAVPSVMPIRSELLEKYVI